MSNTKVNTGTEVPIARFDKDVYTITDAQKQASKERRAAQRKKRSKTKSN